MLVEAIYGMGSMGQNGTPMWRMMMEMERGEPKHVIRYEPDRRVEER
jgi:hypothetical protein